MGQDNMLHWCFIEVEMHVTLKELHEGLACGHFATYIIVQKMLDIGCGVTHVTLQLLRCQPQ